MVQIDRGLSIVMPVYNERDNLEPLHRQITNALKSEDADYEVIYVDDGSDDGSWEVLKNLAAVDPHVKLVRFRRNFGQTAAIAAAIAHAKMPIVVTLDADLQNDPADIPRLVEKLGEEYDVVAG